MEQVNGTVNSSWLQLYSSKNFYFPVTLSLTTRLLFGSVAFNEEESVEAKSFQLKLAAIMSSAFQAILLQTQFVENIS